MALSKYKDRRRARLQFCNRDGIRGLLKRRSKSYEDDPEFFRVISLIGIGGIGKTSLLNQSSQDILNDSRDIKICRVSLEGGSSGSFLVTLRSIRDQLEFQCPYFDAALFVYLKSNNEQLYIPRGSFLSSSVLLDAIGVGSSFVGGIPFPANTTVKIIEYIDRHFSNNLYFDRNVFHDIHKYQFETSELLNRLPHWLGLDVENKLRNSGLRIVFIFDAYERRSHSKLEKPVTWLQEFIGTVERGLYLIASRERLNWKDEWQAILEEHVIDRLSDKDCRKLIVNELGELPTSTIDVALEIIQGIPFFLEACIELLSQEVFHNSDFVAFEKFSQRDLIDRMLDHIDVDEQRLLIHLAITQTFDYRLFKDYIREFGVIYSIESFSDLVRRFFVEAISKSHGSYKTHDLFTDYVISKFDKTDKAATTSLACARSLWIRLENGEDGVPLLPIFYGALKALNHVNNLTLAIRIKDLLIDVGYHLYDQGHWKALMEISENMNSRINGPGAQVANFFAALSLRRLQDIRASLLKLEELNGNDIDYGKHQLSIQVEKAYLEELEGNYSVARLYFSQAYLNCRKLDSQSRPQKRAHLYHADMLIMDGRFKEASIVLASAETILLTESPSDYVEFVRHRAHANRFNFMFEEAELLYIRALEYVGEAPALIAKLETNLLETRCWTESLLTLKKADEVLRKHEYLGNRIEIGKVHTAKCLAFSGLGRSNEAEEQYLSAKKLFAQLGYTAGLLMAEVAGAICSFSSRRDGAFRSRCQKAMDISESLTTYHHILLPLAIMLDDNDKQSELISKCDWFESEGLLIRLRRAMSLFYSARSNHTDL